VQKEIKMKRTHWFSLMTILICLLLLGMGTKAAPEGTDSTATKQNEDKPTSQPANELNLDLGNKVTMKLVLLPAGQFVMGSPEDEKGREATEGPRHGVRITRPFYMGACEVTQEQYQQVMGENPSKSKGASKPVEKVSWHDAAEFCKKLSQKTRRQVALPTEAQWEYACRAGSAGPYCFGDDENKLGDYAWYVYNSEMESHRVGQKKPNAFGLYDMHGNLSEWCRDWFADSYARAGAKDPTGPASGTQRVVRGSSFGDIPRHCRCADRSGAPPDMKVSSVGFRVVMNVEAGGVKAASDLSAHAAVAGSVD